MLCIGLNGDAGTGVRRHKKHKTALCDLNERCCLRILHPPNADSIIASGARIFHNEPNAVRGYEQAMPVAKMETGGFEPRAVHYRREDDEERKIA